MHLIFLAAAALLCVSVDGFMGLHFRKMREPPLPKRRNVDLVSTKHVTQRVDNFNPRDTRTWSMRYMANDAFLKESSPIFILIGGEWTIYPGSLQGGLMYDMAKTHGAYMLYSEHRYYGQSLPTKDASTANLQYLSVDQALADLANLVKHIKAINPGLSNSKVIVFGGSYAGTMAAWFRLKYSHLVHGAVSSSGPLLAEADFYPANRGIFRAAYFPSVWDWLLLRWYTDQFVDDDKTNVLIHSVPSGTGEYLEVVNDALKTEGSVTCADSTQKGIDDLEILLKTPEGVEKVNKLFSLCQPLDVTIKRDVESLFSSIIDSYAGEVQYASSYNENIKKQLCDKVEDNKITPLEGLAAIVRNSQGSGCLDIRFKPMIDELSDGTWGKSPTSSGMRQWYYQTCTEFGFYQTTLSANQPFGNNTLSLELFIDLCKGVYGDIFTEQAEDILNAAVERTNLQYGGLNPAKITNVVFVHGTVDPWHALGVLKDLSTAAPAIVIPGGSHCEDMDSIYTFYDSPQMIAAKEKIISLVASWLK